MKDVRIILVMMMTILFCSFTVVAQEEEEIEEEVEEIIDEVPQGPEMIKGIFDGVENDSYSFNYKNEENEEDAIFFVKVTPEVLKKYNLKDKSFIGKSFEITFISVSDKEVDEDGDEQVFIKRTITDLKPVN